MATSFSSKQHRKSTTSKVPKTIVARVEDIIDSKPMMKDYLELVNLIPNSKGFISCPGHSDSTPSLSVNLETDDWYCFGCGEGGRYLSFYAFYNHISYDKAITIHAKMLGISVREQALVISPPKAPPRPNRCKDYVSVRNQILKIKRKGDIDDIVEFLARMQEAEDSNQVDEFTVEEDKVDVSSLYNLDFEIDLDDDKELDLDNDI